MNKIKNHRIRGRVVVFTLTLFLTYGVVVGKAIDIAQSKPDKHYQKKYNFSEDWFTNRIPVWEKILLPYKGKPNLQYLEIGVFEGSSLIWMLENILTHPTSEATGIDIFPGQLKEIFQENLRIGGFPDKVTVIQGKSQTRLRRLPLNAYNIIYIDGSHKAKDVLTDAVLCWLLLKENGILIFDDYHWKQNDPVQDRPQAAIDSFLVCFEGHYEVIHRNAQIILKKREL